MKQKGLGTRISIKWPLCFEYVHWLRFLLTWLRFPLPWLRFSVLFLSCKANARVKLAKTGHCPHSSTLFVICVVRLLCVLFCVLFVCKCVLPPGDNPTAVNKCISYHIKQRTETWASLRKLQNERGRDTVRILEHRAGFICKIYCS